ncbi:MAG: HhH-GPD [Candidatus Collierbacteria bacterium GW2011_GWB1_45_35]|uniref:DNA-3-methyladenine glycosylase II n=1 Tax=Candidatus Collierbacteria bacterium GW2011_GWB2_45_17 TaxID=1618388 RepID=A0A837IFQ7_9BACT|nr:MAG: HhH-GPD [Microgenomates group bacterium GW2011_GWC1_44_23]KKT96005.1 MAG: HhH-GPD [Candidatus Collierbacteria bacterium GW2011_GWA1_45_15]KKU01122.1 MAG: HhH-GPD [Candidatus Collierbacteria bacterium GW2011_GWB2_45_17]KKU05734.1 MAG: HhH-GPD [Candidatus Collierbacteria bacterium GW2011_GWB1_45_35]KKU08066.1 MAG: HhH-GPD [Candidatus Collierbacteria bacterium GW2011_GWC2_45_40]HBC45132.1 DNA-3-methyladenine glycosylase 2 family protein [Candidatus Collierbacteria bacterium]
MDITAAHRHLKKDSRLAPLLSKYSLSLSKISTDLFRDLLESIIGQQLSVKAASTIIKRFVALFPDPKNIKPKDILAQNADTLRSVGLSRQKISYLQSLSEFILSEKLVLASLKDLSDEAVIENLIQVKGIGRWTAEMILIFSLGREDVFSVGDLGLRTAVSKIYGVDREDKIKIENIAKKWSPYRSLASLYLWQSLDNK